MTSGPGSDEELPNRSTSSSPDYDEPVAADSALDGNDPNGEADGNDHNGEADGNDHNGEADGNDHNGEADGNDTATQADLLAARRRRLGRRLVLVGGVALVFISLAWLAISALLAKRDVSHIKAELGELRSSVSSGDVNQARRTAADIAARAHHAAQLTSGPVWSLAGDVPYVGRPFESVQTLAQVADELGRGVLPDLVEASNELDPSGLQTASGGIDAAKVEAAAPLVHRSVLRLEAASRTIAALPAKTWMTSVDSARDSVAKSMTTLHGSLAGLDRATQVLPAMLGSGGTKRYFIGIMNEAESRGLGGIPGSYIIVNVTKGNISFERYGSDDELKRIDTGLDLGAEYDQRYANTASTQFLLNSTVSPNFPYVAQIWAATWEKFSGEKVDGAIAVDPTALGYLLDVIGPATAPDGLVVSGDNIVSLTESTLYEKFAFNDQASRKAYLLDIASAVETHLLASKNKAAGLVKAAFKGGDERRILIWSADPTVEKVLQTTSFAGDISPTASPYTGFVVNNAAATKLDYYLDRGLTWTRTGCGSTRKVTATITLTNGAPAKGLAYYVTTRYDTTFSDVAGSNRLQVIYYATPGAALDSVTIDGKPSTVTPASELNHPTYFMDLEMPVGATRTIVLTLTEPAGTGAPTVLEQPGVRPLSVTLNDAKCD